MTTVPIRRDGAVVARLDVTETAAGPVAVLHRAVRGLTSAEAVAAVRALLDAVPGPGLVLDAQDVVLRDAARAAGFDGPLRARLERPAAPAPPAPPETRLARLLPGVEITDWKRRGAWMRLTTGVADIVSFRVRRRGASLAMRCPWRATTLVEPLAAAADTALWLVERFPILARARLAFEVSDTGMVSHRVAGYAGSAAVAVNAAYVDARLHDRLVLEDVRPPRADDGPGRVWWIDEVVVHELGHQLDFEGGTISGRTDFRARIGRALGVESVEQALRGGEATAPPAWRVARAALAGAVSAYATTNTYELFAELFVAATQVRNPVTEEFVRLLVEHYPAPAGCPDGIWPGPAFGG